MRPFGSRPALAPIAPAALCVAALATLGFPGCPDATGPGGGVDSSRLTMSNCWPNDDGRFWEYDARSCALAVEPMDELPEGETAPAITLADARRLLAEPVTREQPNPDEYPVRFQFEGQLTTQSGVTGQNLDVRVPVRAASMRAASPAERGDPFLARLAAARPDLRARIAALTATPADAEGMSWLPLFIHGYAWVKGPAWIGTYGDVDTLPAWKFLESNVRTGHTFRHQLVPSLASDVWLLASVERQVAVTVPGGAKVSNAIEVLYVVDYGVSVSVDAMGNILGSFRTFDYGKVVYAPGVGPVSDVERRLAYRGRNLTHGLHLLELNLASTGIVTPALTASGRPAS